MPEPVKPNDTFVDFRFTPQGLEPATAAEAANGSFGPTATCANCGKVNRAEAAVCSHCSHAMFPDLVAAAGNQPPLEFEGSAALAGRLRLLRPLKTFGGVQSFLALECGDDPRVVVVRTGLRQPDAIAVSAQTPVQPPSLNKTSVNTRRPDETDDTIPLPVIYAGAQDPLIFERDMLPTLADGVFPKLLDSFSGETHNYLVLAPTPGVALFEAWNDPQYDAPTKVGWLEQIRRALASLHPYHLVFAKLDPDSISVDGSKVRIDALQGLVRVPVQAIEPAWSDLSTAPELLSNPTQTDLRSNAFCFGALLLSLHLGRKLKESDFLLPGVPKPLTELLPDAPPPLVRLLSKTFAHNVNLRFPSPRYRWRDPSGFDEIGEALAEYGRAINSVSFDIAGWSTTGTIRGSNEDCFTVAYLTSGAREYRRDVAFLCVADGMGGHAGGEVASSLAAATLNAFLRQNGLSVESLQQLDAERSFDDVERAATVLREAVDAANDAVRDAAQADPNRPTMGCTLEAMLLVDRRGILCHVGDSRVYHFCEGCLIQITRDQTMVNRLVDLGRLTAEEAASHPRRFELAQAIGSQKEVVPDQFVLELNEGDWLLLCSDGLTAHVNERQIRDALVAAPNAELAARRLVNLAIAQGGSDNCTLIVAKVR